MAKLTFFRQRREVGSGILDGRPDAHHERLQGLQVADAGGGLFLVPDHRGAPAKTGDNDLARLQFVLTYSFVTLAV